MYLNQDVIHFIESNTISEIFSYNVFDRKYFLTEAINKKEVMEALFQKLSLTPNTESPFLFPGV